MTIKEIDQRLLVLSNQERLIHEERAKLETKRAELSFGVKIGEEIEYQGKKYQVSGFRGRYWVEGHPTNKDGTFSKRIATLYNFKGKSL